MKLDVFGFHQTVHHGVDGQRRDTAGAELFGQVLAVRDDSRQADTQARGDFSFEFDRYAEAPSNIAEKIIAAAKAE